ncbi:hypothetical protein QQ054_31980 [Oscillatoria amoena NRMC-F 0135]|nr:hypothetical protein [Oscillatoria amoena NRMC-F 0135]
MSPIIPPQAAIEFARKLNDEQAAAVWKAAEFIDNPAPYLVKQKLDELKAALVIIDEEEE